MAKRMKTILYTAPEPWDGERARAEKSRMTAAAQKAMNDKTARGKLEMLIAENFTGREPRLDPVSQAAFEAIKRDFAQKGKLGWE